MNSREFTNKKGDALPMNFHSFGVRRRELIREFVTPFPLVLERRFSDECANKNSREFTNMKGDALPMNLHSFGVRRKELIREFVA